MEIGMIGAGSIVGIMVGTIKEMDCAQNYTAATGDYGGTAEFAQKYSFKKACGSYEELMEDAGIELVCIAALHSYHYEHTKLCLNHGKHVLYEKSFMVNESQVREMPELAREEKLLLVEAIWTRHMPMGKTLDDVLLSGAIGRPYMLTADLDYIISGKERIMCPKLAERALPDVGIYPPNFASMVFGDKVDTITDTAVITETGVDAQNSITITYRNGRMAVLRSSTTGLSNHRDVTYGDDGFIRAENISSCKGTRIYDCSGNMIASHDTPKRISGYEYEVGACLRTVEEGALECPEMPHEGTLRMMGRMDEFRR